jgi:hypothetical protein
MVNNTYDDTSALMLNLLNCINYSTISHIRRCFHSMFLTVDVLSLDLLAQSALFPFDGISSRCPFNVLSSSTFFRFDLLFQSAFTFQHHVPFGVD